MYPQVRNVSGQQITASPFQMWQFCGGFHQNCRFWRPKGQGTPEKMEGLAGWPVVGPGPWQFRVVLGGDGQRSPQHRQATAQLPEVVQQLGAAVPASDAALALFVGLFRKDQTKHSSQNTNRSTDMLIVSAALLVVCIDGLEVVFE